MNTFTQDQFKINELIQRIYGVICAHHTVSLQTAKQLALYMNTPDMCVVEQEFSTFGEGSENPLYLSYEVKTWVHPDYDRSAFNPADHEHAIQFGFTIESITFYESESEKMKHAEELASQALLHLAMTTSINSNN